MTHNKLFFSNVTKATKTPAQDRLKRLQSSLKTTRNHSRTLNASPSEIGVNLKNFKEKKLENVLKDNPDKNITKTSKIAIKRPYNSDSTVEDKNSMKTKKLCLKEEFKSAKLQATHTSSTKSMSEKKAGSSTSSTLSNLKTGIFKKIKDMCKIRNSAARNEKTSFSNLDNSAACKPTKKLNNNNSIQQPPLSLEDAIIRKLRSDNDNSFDANSIVPSASKCFSKNINIPSDVKGSGKF